MKKGPALSLIVSVLIALSAIGGYVFWYDLMQGLRTETAQLETDILAKEGERIRAASARTAEDDLLAQENFIASHLVKTDDIVLFLETIEGTGKAFGATVQVASVSGEGKASNGKISLSLSITGTFDAVMRTLGAIENGPYANMVSDLTLDTPDKGETWSAVGVFVVGTELK